MESKKEISLLERASERNGPRAVALAVQLRFCQNWRKCFRS